MAEAKTLPRDSDSRLVGFRGQVTHPTMPLQRTYCFLCGKPWGYCSMDSSEQNAPQHIVVTCDDCDFAMYQAGAAAVPTHVLDAYGLIKEPAPEAAKEN